MFSICYSRIILNQKVNADLHFTFTEEDFLRIQILFIFIIILIYIFYNSRHNFPRVLFKCLERAELGDSLW